MNNKKRLLLGSGLLSLSVSGFAADIQGENPNVILILVDDLGKEWIQQYGAENIELPNLQRLADESYVFQRAYSMPQSTPSRIALLTGQYPYHNGWVNHYDVPRWGYGAHYDFSQNPCFPRLIKENGYKTCSAGKWQLNDFRLQPDAMEQAGFDEYCMWTGGEGGNEKISESRYWDPYIHTKEGSKLYKGSFGPDIYSDFIVDFITENKKHPMFIYYPMTLTHTPFVHTPHDMEAKTPYEKHRAMVKYTDFIVGKILKCLEDNSLQDNTYVIFTTDNGTSSACVGKRNEQYIRGGKTMLSENGINCPFIVHVPGQTKKYQSDALIDFTDLYPTILELTKTKADKRYLTDGHSFVSVLNGKKNSVREWALAMGSHPARIGADGMVKNQVDFRDRVIIGTNYKIYLTQQRMIDRVYDIVKDPFELKNLVEDERILKRAEKELGKIIKAFPLVDANPHYTPLDHNKEWDFPLNEMNAKSKAKRGNYMPVSTERDYINFIGNKNNKKKK